MARHKPPPARYTKAQNKSYAAWVKAHPFKNQPARTGRPQPQGGGGGGTANHGGGQHGKGRHGKGRHGLALPGSTLAGEPLCAATAVAAQLWLTTSIQATTADVEALHRHAGGNGDGAWLEDTLAAARRFGLAGVRLLGVTPCLPVEGALVSLALETAQADQQVWQDEPSPLWGLHAAVGAAGGFLSWGRHIPCTEGFPCRQVLGAWALTWETP